jgi:diguanylate cyclase (GGDEF)-like protein
MFRIVPFGPTVCSLVLWQEGPFLRNALINILLFGLLFGIMLCMTCYNFFLFLSLKRNIYLVYVIYIFSILCYVLILDGHATVLLDVSHFDLKSIEWFFLGTSIIFATWFCQKFLDTRRFTPRWHWAMVFFQLMAFIIIVLGLLEDHDAAAKLATAEGLVGPIFLLIVGIIRWRQGFGAAKFYLLASLTFILGTLSFMLWSLNVLPQRINGELLFTLGPTLESILFSFALADRIRSLENEKLVLAQSQARYKKASQIDGLTELFNKNHFMQLLEKMAEGAANNRHPLSFAILDIDDFKRFNDNHGHQLGDDVLRSMGRVIRNELRGPDIAGRYGGEEFTLAFPNSTAAQASHAVERIRKSFASQVFQSFDSNPGVSATLSLGLAQLKQGESAAGLIKRADQALYEAKNTGKNRIMLAK